MKIINITCERVRTPLAVTNRCPRFSWEIISDEKDVLQSAYHIIVKDHTGALVWDSGKAQSRETVPADMYIRSRSGTTTEMKR